MGDCAQRSPHGWTAAVVPYQADGTNILCKTGHESGEATYGPRCDRGAVIPERLNAGVYVIDAANNVVGGPQEGQGNTIAARTYGVRVVGPEAATNQVEGNIVDVIEEESESEGD